MESGVNLMSTIIYAYQQSKWTGKEPLYSVGHNNPFQSIPYYSIELVHQDYAANTCNFDSTVLIGENSPIKVSGVHKAFTGTVQKRTEKPGYYSYECIDHTKKLFGSQNGYFQNSKPSGIVKSYLHLNGFSTSGVENSWKKQPKLVWKNVKLFNIIQQLAVLDNKEFFFNEDGIPIFRTPATAIKGYVFLPEQSVSDYELSIDNSNIVTDVRVFGAEDQYLAQSTSPTLVYKYGDITEFLTDSNITTADAAKKKAQAQLKLKGRVQFSGNMVLPQILDIGNGEWCALANPKWSRTSTIRPYYIQKVTTRIDESTEEQTLELLDREPAPPEEFIYRDLTGNTLSCVASGTNHDIVTGSMMPSSCYCTKKFPKAYKHYTKSWLNYCPLCGKYGKLRDTPKGGRKKIPEGEWTCDTAIGGCGADFDGVCGYEKYCSPHGHLTPATGVGNSTTCKTGSVPEIGNAFIPRSPRDIRLWIDQNIRYSYYYNNKYSVSQVIKLRKGNCYDQSELFRYMVNGYFPGQYKTAAHKFTVTGGCGSYRGGHQNSYIWINGRKIVADTTCHGLNQL